MVRVSTNHFKNFIMACGNAGHFFAICLIILPRRLGGARKNGLNGDAWFIHALIGEKNAL
jgi:hypothetical protein